MFRHSFWIAISAAIFAVLPGSSAFAQDMGTDGASATAVEEPKSERERRLGSIRPGSLIRYRTGSGVRTGWVKANDGIRLTMKSRSPLELLYEDLERVEVRRSLGPDVVFTTIGVVAGGTVGFIAGRLIDGTSGDSDSDGAAGTVLLTVLGMAAGGGVCALISYTFGLRWVPVYDDGAVP